MRFLTGACGAQAPGYSSGAVGSMGATERSNMISTYGRRHPSYLSGFSHRMLGEPSSHDRQLESLIGKVSRVVYSLRGPETSSRICFCAYRVCIHVYLRSHLVPTCMHVFLGMHSCGSCECALTHMCMCILQNYSTFQEAHSATYFQPESFVSEHSIVKPSAELDKVFDGLA